MTLLLPHDEAFLKCPRNQGRTHLFFSIAEILHAKKPRVVFLENVKNLVSHDEGQTFAVIRKRLEALGYLLKHQVLDGAEYGNVLQHRERVFLVAFREQQDYDNFSFPSKIALDRSQLPELIRYSIKQAPEFYLTDQNNRVAEAMRATVQKQGVFYRWWRCQVREKRGGVCPTLMANINTVPVIMDNYGIRKITPRECFALQGYPKDFVLPALANCHLYKQAGNSVVVPLVRRVGRKIVEALVKTDGGGFLRDATLYSTR